MLEFAALLNLFSGTAGSHEAVWVARYSAHTTGCQERQDIATLQGQSGSYVQSKPCKY